uniref:Ribonuclease H protein At1g65750 family n=1 Tax=Cajanus cajan TaxID=3821 RepID=A0A151QYE5_CAJCA|nr:Putative ribonuclease H protein At1g65750 family [Cajanus cajan]
MVQLVVYLHLWKGFIVGKDKIQMSHLQFADDTLLLIQGEWRSLETIKAILQNFELVSGLKVNFSKSNLIGINMPDQWLEQVENLLNCRRAAFPFKYLGLPVGDHPTRGAMWQVMVDVVQRRLALWEKKYISLAGRVILLKSVLSALPTYFLSFYKAPMGILSRIESIFKSFLWGERVCRSKEEGGLGLCDLCKFNMALLGKWKWRMLTEPDSQWVRVLNSKYAFWHDRWIGETHFGDEFSRLHGLSLNKNDSVEEMYRGGSKWWWSLRRPLFAWEEEKLVELANRLASVVLTEAHPDEWRWLTKRSGKYSVASAYKILAKSNHVQVDTFYDTIWSKGIPPKVQVLVWQLEGDRLPTRDNLFLRGVNLEGHNGCVFCKEGLESSKHLFLLCPKAYVV